MPDHVTREEWRRKILEDLGGDGVDPDLNEAQLDGALDRALDTWNKHRPHTTWFPFDIPAAETTVINFFAEKEQNDPDGHPFGYVANVLEVQFADRNRRILGARAGFMEGYYLRWGYQGPRLFFELHVAERTYERLTGSRPDWRWDPATRKLFISSPSRDLRAMVLCSRRRRLEELRYDNAADFRALATAAAKTVLARVLGSRGPIPGPAGNIETDAKDLREEGKAEWKEIEQRLQTALVSHPPAGYVG